MLFDCRAASFAFSIFHIDAPSDLTAIEEQSNENIGLNTRGFEFMSMIECVLMFMFSCRSFQEANKRRIESHTKRNVNEQRIVHKNHFRISISIYHLVWSNEIQI